MNEDRWRQSGQGQWEDDRGRFERAYGRREEFERNTRDDESSGADRSRNYGSSRSDNDWSGQRTRYAESGRERERWSGSGWPNRYGGEADDRYGGDWDRARGRAYRSGSGTRYGSSSDWGRRDPNDWSRSYGEGWGDYRDHSREYGAWRGEGQGYGDYGRSWREGRSHPGGERDWWQRTKDEVRSWMGDEDANHRREMDDMRERRNRGPRGYTRSDERIKEDVSDRLSEGWLDASDIEVQVSGAEVTLNGHVDSRSAKRRAEDLAESVAGVRHVQNNLRVRDPSEASTVSATGSASSTASSSSPGTPTTGTTRPRH